MNTPENTPKIVSTVCKCGQSYESEIFDWSDLGEPERRMLLSPRCPDCQAKKEAEQEAERIKAEEAARQERMDRASSRIATITPDRFRRTSKTHPTFNIELWKRVAAWQPTPEKPWLGLVGATGTSKSRCGFLRLREAALSGANEGRPVSIEAVTGYKFGPLVLDQFQQGSDGGAGERLHTLKSADWLVFDEIGKTRSSPAILAEFFGLIDHRHAHNRPMVWTSNTAPEVFAAGYGDEYAEPLAGRIVECSTIITT